MCLDCYCSFAVCSLLHVCVQCMRYTLIEHTYVESRAVRSNAAPVSICEHVAYYTHSVRFAQPSTMYVCTA